MALGVEIPDVAALVYSSVQKAIQWEWNAIEAARKEPHAD